jgi:hypothetical protein
MMRRPLTVPVNWYKSKQMKADGVEHGNAVWMILPQCLCVTYIFECGDEVIEFLIVALVRTPDVNHRSQ